MTASNSAPITPQSRAGVRAKFLLLILTCTAVAFVALRFFRAPAPDKTFSRAQAALANGDVDTAMQALKVLRNERGYVGHCNLLEGAILLRNGDYVQSLYSLRTAAEEPVLEVEALILAGQAQYQLHRAGEAHELWRRALKLNPAAVEAHRWMGVLYYDLGAMDQAMEHLERVSKLAPQDYRPDRLMGLICKDYEKYQTAIDHYQESLNRNPNQPNRNVVLMELAESQVNATDFQGALTTLKSCQDSIERATLEAECLFATGDTEQASELTTQVLDKEPEHLSAVRLRARILLAGGKFNEAIELLRSAADSHPKDHQLWYLLSQACSKAGDETNAAKALQESETLKNAWLEFSRLNTEAIYQPLNSDLRYQLGVLALELSRPDLAEGWFRATLALAPDHEQAAKALRKIDK
ncbi:MAG: tetratricopeptide repeat protein [Planctomycetaceae bacterium]|nr:tetratricopeptide repeat protein [Planctomycetales bacterium]MCB9924820.1 tetratricopeptide repeat protein [Planctomycetaceae bacterium]